MVPVRDASANFVFQGRPAYKLVEEPRAKAQPVNQAEIESINSSKVETEKGEGEMVTKRTMTTDRFLPGACSVAQ